MQVDFEIPVKCDVECLKYYLQAQAEHFISDKARLQVL